MGLERLNFNNNIPNRVKHMECKKCRYFREEHGWTTYRACDITHRVNPTCCDIISDEDVVNMDICYNCKYWFGGGDWGLSCAKNYYNCSCNGFDKACKQFERKKIDQIEVT